MKNWLLRHGYRLFALGLLATGGLLPAATQGQERTAPAPVTVTGTLEVLISDNFNQGISKTSYFLKTEDGTVYELQFGEAPPANLRTGQQATVKGYVQDHQLKVIP